MISRASEVYRNRLLSMASCEWQLREQSTLTGFLWTLLQPALMFGTLYLVFTHWLKVTSPGFAPRLLIGVVLYSFFQSATSYGLTSLNRRAPMVMSFVFDREIIVLAACLSVAASHVLELVIMCVFLAALGSPPTASWLLLPLLVLASAALACGLALALAVLTARHPDFERVWAVLLMAGFYLTPVFYRPGGIDDERVVILRLNPLTYLLESARACLLEGRAEWLTAAALLALGAVALGVGLLVFRSSESRLGDYLNRAV